MEPGVNHVIISDFAKLIRESLVWSNSVPTFLLLQYFPLRDAVGTAWGTGWDSLISGWAGGWGIL